MSFKTPKTAWNGDQLGYQEIILTPNDSRECSYCLTQPQAKALIALIDRYRYATRWYSQDAAIERELIEQFVNDCQRRLMMACCGDEIPIQYRYTEDGDLEMSEDGGTTWTPAPERDPRVYSPTFPPPTGDQADKCVAADAGVTSIIADVFNELAADMSKAELDALIHTWVSTYITTANPLQALLAVVINVIFGLGITLLIAALTTEVWNKLRCCFHNNMADDLSFDHDQWEAVRDCITSEIGGIAGIFLEHLIYLAGPKGLTNICRSALGSPTADCSDCIPPSCLTFWNTSEPHEQYGTITYHPDDGYFDVEAGLNGSTYTVIMFTGTGSDNMQCCNMMDREFLVGNLLGSPLWYNCGSDSSVTGIPGWECCYDIQMFSNVPFTVRFRPTDC